MLRVVADANVLISAALARSPEAPSVLVLDAALDGRVELVTSPLLLREIASVLARPRLRTYLSLDEADRFSADLAVQTVLIADPSGTAQAICRDPHDDYLVALAHAANAQVLVTGDLDLIAIDPAELSFEILTPRGLIDRLVAEDARKGRRSWLIRLFAVVRRTMSGRYGHRS
jgi:putative PIN family toxin of toxin-antitoxin system